MCHKFNDSYWNLFSSANNFMLLCIISLQKSPKIDIRITKIRKENKIFVKRSRRPPIPQLASALILRDIAQEDIHFQRDNAYQTFTSFSLVSCIMLLGRYLTNVSKWERLQNLVEKVQDKAVISFWKLERSSEN